jgi:hypothetical protein
MLGGSVTLLEIVEYSSTLTLYVPMAAMLKATWYSLDVELKRTSSTTIAPPPVTGVKMARIL